MKNPDWPPQQPAAEKEPTRPDNQENEKDPAFRKKKAKFEGDIRAAKKRLDDLEKRITEARDRDENPPAKVLRDFNEAEKKYSRLVKQQEDFLSGKDTQEDAQDAPQCFDYIGGNCNC